VHKMTKTLSQLKTRILEDETPCPLQRPDLVRGGHAIASAQRRQPDAERAVGARSTTTRGPGRGGDGPLRAVMRFVREARRAGQKYPNAGQ
jgi:hypothetical protein